MSDKIKMYIIVDGKKLEQEIPVGLVDIYREKGWKEVKVVEEKKSIFSIKKEEDKFNK